MACTIIAKHPNCPEPTSIHTGWFHIRARQRATLPVLFNSRVSVMAAESEPADDVFPAIIVSCMTAIIVANTVTVASD